eukprot:9438850-Prorocentrum_lima.AAC.1
MQCLSNVYQESGEPSHECAEEEQLSCLPGGTAKRDRWVDRKDRLVVPLSGPRSGPVVGPHTR